jgi:hypothetical protein
MKAVLEMEMPESCKMCVLKSYDNLNRKFFCAALFRTWIDDRVGYGLGRHPDCPLKPVEE